MTRSSLLPKCLGENTLFTNICLAWQGPAAVVRGRAGRNGAGVKGLDCFWHHPHVGKAGLCSRRVWGGSSVPPVSPPVLLQPNRTASHWLITGSYVLGPVPALTVSWANYFLLPASLTLPAFSCPARTSAHFMQSNVEVQEIWGNVRSHLLCESVLADDRCQDLVTFPFCLNQHLAVLQTRFKSLGGVIASRLWCVSFSGLNIKNWFECSWSCFWLPLRYGTS